MRRDEPGAVARGAGQTAQCVRGFALPGGHGGDAVATALCVGKATWIWILLRSPGRGRRFPVVASRSTDDVGAEFGAEGVEGAVELAVLLVTEALFFGGLVFLGEEG